MSSAAAHSDTAGFSIGPLTTYADSAQMACWLERAAVGDEMIYATGPVAGDHPATRLARTMHDGGLVELFQRRSGRAHCFDYCARKKGASSGGPTGRPSAPSGSLREDAGSPPSAEVLERRILTLPLDEARVYQCVARAAQADAPCPSLSAIAAQCLLRNRFRAKYLLGRLCELGLLAKHDRPAGAPRELPMVFDVIALGKSTQTGDGE